MASLTLGLISIWVFFCVYVFQVLHPLNHFTLSRLYMRWMMPCVHQYSLCCLYSFAKWFLAVCSYDSIVSDPYTIWLTPPLFIFTAAILSLKICLLYYIIERLFRVFGHREENMDDRAAAEIPWIPRHCINPRPIQFSIQFFFCWGEDIEERILFDKFLFSIRKKKYFRYIVSVCDSALWLYTPVVVMYKFRRCGSRPGENRLFPRRNQLIWGMQLIGSNTVKYDGN